MGAEAHLDRDMHVCANVNDPKCIYVHICAYMCICKWAYRHVHTHTLSLVRLRKDVSILCVHLVHLSFYLHFPVFFLPAERRKKRRIEKSSGNGWTV